MPLLEEFTRHRPRLFALAYRMLGTVTDAEDVAERGHAVGRRRQGPGRVAADCRRTERRGFSSASCGKARPD